MAIHDSFSVMTIGVETHILILLLTNHRFVNAGIVRILNLLMHIAHPIYLLNLCVISNLHLLHATQHYSMAHIWNQSEGFNKSVIMSLGKLLLLSFLSIVLIWKYLLVIIIKNYICRRC